MITGSKILPSGIRNNLTKFKTFPVWNKRYFSYGDIITYLKTLTAGSSQIDIATTFGNFAGTTTQWVGGILAPNGCIYGIPYTSTSILKIDPTNDTTTTFGNFAGTTKWQSGILAPNGCIYGIPYTSTSILKILSSQNLNPNLPLSQLFNKY